MRFDDGESALVVKRWFERVEDDASGCTFLICGIGSKKRYIAPGTPPAAMFHDIMLVNSSKLRDVFGSEQFQKVMPLTFNNGRKQRSTRGAAIRELEGVGIQRFVLQAGRDSGDSVIELCRLGLSCAVVLIHRVYGQTLFCA